MMECCNRATGWSTYPQFKHEGFELEIENEAGEVIDTERKLRTSFVKGFGNGTAVVADFLTCTESRKGF